MTACSTDDPTQDGRDDTFTTADGKADGSIEEGSPRALAVLRVANTQSSEVLGAPQPRGVGLGAIATSNLIEFRVGPDGMSGTADDRPIGSLAELDAIPFIGPIAFERLVAYADVHGGASACTAKWTPIAGSRDTQFVFQYETTNATDCTLTFDNGTPTRMGCAYAAGWLGRDVGAGTHRYTVSASGEAGTVECSASVTVEPTDQPCEISWTPTQGGPDTFFVLKYRGTNATDCSLSQDGGTPTRMGCTYAAGWFGREIGTGAGTHTSTLNATGTLGAARCSASVTVVAGG